MEILFRLLLEYPEAFDAHELPCCLRHLVDEELNGESSPSEGAPQIFV